MKAVAGALCAMITTSVIAMAPLPAAAAATMAHRAYDATALAVPMNPEVGSHDSPIPARLFTTRADVSNPPRAASARAARTDLGLLEQFVPGQALGPAADASTRDRNSGRDSRTTDGDAVYVAHADKAPSARATATGVTAPGASLGFGGMSSTSTARLDGSRLLATATSTLTGMSLGPISVGTATYTATASTTGRAGGAHATGVVTASEASVAGVPVAITQDGVEVDSTRIVLGQLDQAAAVVAAAFAESGYLDARLVQPVTTHRRDGSSATVTGGGIQLIGRSDANQSYYLAATMLSGEVSVAVGDSLGQLRLPVTPAPTARPAAPETSGLGPPYTPTTSVAGAMTAPSATAAPAVAPLYTSQASEVELPHIWPWWPVLLGLAVALAMSFGTLRLPVAGPVRRRLLAMTAAAADRYFRG